MRRETKGLPRLIPLAETKARFSTAHADDKAFRHPASSSTAIKHTLKPSRIVFTLTAVCAINPFLGSGNHNAAPSSDSGLRRGQPP